MEVCFSAIEVDMKNKYVQINIISPIADLFRKQLSPKWLLEGYEFFFNSKEDIIWDAVVIYENITEKYKLKYRAGGLFFISGEPSIVKVYSSEFLNIFDHIISSHIKIKNNHNDQQALPWYFGYNFRTSSPSLTYDQIEKLEVPIKLNKISFVTSTRTFLPGHNKRIKWLNVLQKEVKEGVDYFGRGICEIEDKKDALLPYKFSICIENSCIKDYWTEKIADAFLGYAVPIYYGCNNITKYFSEESLVMIDIADIMTSISRIRDILDNMDEYYQEKLPYIKEAREKVLYQYNIFPFIKSYLDRYVNLSLQKNVEIEIFPYDSYRKDHFGEMALKLKRVIYKMF